MLDMFQATAKIVNPNGFEHTMMVDASVHARVRELRHVPTELHLHLLSLPGLPDPTKSTQVHTCPRVDA